MAKLAAIFRDDIANFLHPTELSGVGEEKLNAIIVSVCDLVNGYAAACPRNPQIKPGTTAVPHELKHAACVLIRKTILSGTMPGTSELLDQATRDSEYQAALSTLRAAAACQINLADYSESDETEPVEIIHGGSNPILDFTPL